LSGAAYGVVVEDLDPDLRAIDLGLHRLRDLAYPEHVWQLVP
jgi:hypothetical protein